MQVDLHPDAAHTRESREWWAITDTHDVVRVTGYSCAPNAPKTWWVPSLGFSMTEEFHLFATEAAALEKVMTNLTRLSDQTNEMIAAFRLRLSMLPGKGLTPR